MGVRLRSGRRLLPGATACFHVCFRSDALAPRVVTVGLRAVHQCLSTFANVHILRLIEESVEIACLSRIDGFRWGMIRGGFLSAEDRGQLIALARDGSAVSRMTRRANALVLLDDGWSCQQVARALLLNDDTIRDWHKLFEQRGIEGLTSFDMGGSASFLSA
jgi:Homeodomain-like domain